MIALPTRRMREDFATIKYFFSTQPRTSKTTRVAIGAADNFGWRVFHANPRGRSQHEFV